MTEQRYEINIDARENWGDRIALFWLYFKFTFEILLRGHTWMKITEKTYDAMDITDPPEERKENA